MVEGEAAMGLTPKPSEGERGSPSEAPQAARAGPKLQSADEAVAPADLQLRRGGDGSFSLWSPTFREGFHSGRGALREARETFLAPSQLERFLPDRRLRVMEVCVGTGTNLAMLLERCAELGLALEWWGLELDPVPLELALSRAEFRGQWHQQSLETLAELSERGAWQNPMSCGRMLWGDARRTLPPWIEQHGCQLDLVWHDAFSPQHCPQLWTVEFLNRLAALMAPEGRWISYCSAAAVREVLRLAKLDLMALPITDRTQEPREAQPSESKGAIHSIASAEQQQAWSGGTVASRARMEPSPLWRPLSAMERDHLASSAGEPYRDPTGTATAQAILDNRREAQACGSRSSGSTWRKRWGVNGRKRN